MSYANDGYKQRSAYRRFREPRRSSTSFFPSLLTELLNMQVSCRGWKQEKLEVIGKIMTFYLDMRLDNREARWRQTFALTNFVHAFESFVSVEKLCECLKALWVFRSVVNVCIVLLYPRLWIATQCGACVVKSLKRRTICYVVLSFYNWEHLFICITTPHDAIFAVHRYAPQCYCCGGSWTYEWAWRWSVRRC